MEDKQSTGNTDTLAEQLARANQRIAQMSEELGNLQIEQKLAQKLVAAGVADLETALLVAKARMEGKSEGEINSCVDQLRKEKSYLFSGSAQVLTARRTAGARERTTHNQTALEQAAKKAARTGSRTDLLQYLKLRRTLL
jgi:TRAP-type mannitol/chloroaromatic compound transport system substrate-binding protein